MANAVDKAAATMIRNLEEKTGRSLAEWVKVARELGLAKHTEIVKALKSDHGLTHGYANMVALEARSAAVSAPAAGEDLVAAQYAGDKAPLRAVYDRILEAVSAFGADVEVSPKKSYVSLRRSKQFALVQPSTKTRVDVGLNLKGVAPAGRLEASGSFNSMCTHRVRVEDPAMVDGELVAWLRAAYDAA